MDFALVLLIAFTVFLVVFVKTELGLYLVIFSMLLSPEIATGTVSAPVTLVGPMLSAAGAVVIPAESAAKWR